MIMIAVDDYKSLYYSELKKVRADLCEELSDLSSTILNLEDKISDAYDLAHDCEIFIKKTDAICDGLVEKELDLKFILEDVEEELRYRDDNGLITYTKQELEEAGQIVLF
jgi:hypothetical protein